MLKTNRAPAGELELYKEKPHFNFNKSEEKSQ